MKCPDCENIELELDFFSSNRDEDIFEVVWKCPSCGEVFFATIYRKEKGGDEDA